MATITLNQLAHSYDGQKFALQNLDHRWKQGGAYALLGPSGCGKSTLLNIISVLLTPSQGEVMFDQTVVNELSPQPRNLAQVFQFSVFYDALTVAQNLAFPLTHLKAYPNPNQHSVSEIGALLGLSDSLNSKSNGLGRGRETKNFDGPRTGAR